MALNYSYRPIFPAHRSEENLVQGGSQDKDIRDLLPADPFGMDISSTVTAITGWLEDLRLSDGYGGSEAGVGKGDQPLFAKWNFVWNTATMEFQTFQGNKEADDRILKDTRFDDFFPVEGFGHSLYNGGVSFACTLEGAKCCTPDSGCFDRIDNYRKNSGVDGFILEKEIGDAVYDMGLHSACTLEAAKCGTSNASFEMSDHYGKNIVVDVDADDGAGASLQESFLDDGSGARHQAFFLALTHLGVRDLLSVERVCKSLCSTVQTDPLLWRNIHIDQPLNDRLTDDVLLQLTNRAQGNLQCLSLVGCQRITDDALKRVLESNLRLTKLSVPGCTKLSIDCLVNCLRSFKSVAVTGIKYLQIGGLYSVTEKHFEELMSLLGVHNHVQANRHKPRFFHLENVYLSSEDDRPIDIDLCPRCRNLRVVYDCPVEGCQGKNHPTQLCRGCRLCIKRCIQCGKCVDGSVYEETFCLEYLCSDCWEQVLQCQEAQKQQQEEERQQQQQQQQQQERHVGNNNPFKHAVSQEPGISFHG